MGTKQLAVQCTAERRSEQIDSRPLLRGEIGAAAVIAACDPAHVRRR